MISLLHIPLDVESLWTTDDPAYIAFARAVVAQAAALNEEANRQ